MVITIKTEKSLQNSTSIYGKKKKNVKKGDIEDMYFNIVYDKSLGDIINEKLKDFPLRLGIRQGCLLLPLSFNKSLEVLARGKKGI